MANKINLITGETYSLAEIFSGKRKIVIPDLQRDYCWGDKRVGEDAKNLVKEFLQTLIHQFKDSRYGKLSIGLIYGYESPENFVQLCDGQQRITTLFLLLGMLNKWSNDNLFRHLLISDPEHLGEDHNPYLQYSIRDSSLYFLGDLVCFFFDTNSEYGKSLQEVSDIRNTDTNESIDWYYSDYSTDPSIVSILEALKTIESFKDEITNLSGKDSILEFGTFISERLTFIYYDMGSRSNGEETYVVINTTGEPLSATENLKPLVLNASINQRYLGNANLLPGSNMDIPEIWEYIENWFWLNRDINSQETAEKGFNEFLRWVHIIWLYRNSGSSQVNIDYKDVLKEGSRFSFPYECISIKEILDYFLAFKTLFPYFKEFPVNAGKGSTNPGQGETLSQAQCFIVLPMMTYIKEHPAATKTDLKRLYEFLRNLLRTENVTKDINNLVGDSLLISIECTDTIDILKIGNRLSKTIFTLEEDLKLQLIVYFQQINMRDDIETALWEAQNLCVDDNKSLFSGRISSILDWCFIGNRIPSNFNLKSFSEYLDLIKDCFKNFENYADAAINDKTRRGLLAFKLTSYPYGTSYGWGENWHYIIDYAPNDFKEFLDKVSIDGIDKIIESGEDNIFVRYPQLLEYTDRKNVRDYPEWGLTLCKRGWAQPVTVNLALILINLHLPINKDEHSFRSFKVRLSDGNQMEITPNFTDTSISKIYLSSVQNGKIIQWHYILGIPSGEHEVNIMKTLDSTLEFLSKLQNRQTGRFSKFRKKKNSKRRITKSKRFKR